MKKFIDSSVLDGANARNFRQFNSEATISPVVEFKCGNNRYVEGHKRHLRMSKGIVVGEKGQLPLKSIHT